MTLNEMDTPMLRETYRDIQSKAVDSYFKYLSKTNPKKLFNKWVSDELACLDMSAEPRNWVMAADRVLKMVTEINEAEEAEANLRLADPE
jgi:hypothetical protein